MSEEKISLREITPENWREDLSVGKEQGKFVSDRFKILARAYAYRESGSRAFMIYADETAVGMGLYYELKEWKAYELSQLFIDKKYQGRGYGKRAMELVLECLRREGKYQKVLLCYIEGNDTARNLYESLGFCSTGERDGDEIVMEKMLGM